MGNYCCNYSEPNKKHNLHYDNKPEKLDANLTELLKEAEKNEDKIVKIQAAIRGA